MKANYKPRDGRAFRKLSKDDQDSVYRVAGEYAAERFNEYAEQLREELAKHYAENVIPRERAEAMDQGLDIAMMQVMLILIEEFGWGTRPTVGELKLEKLMRLVNDSVVQGMAEHSDEKHAHDIDMYRYALYSRLKDYGVNYTITVKPREDAEG